MQWSSKVRKCCVGREITITEPGENARATFWQRLQPSRTASMRRVKDDPPKTTHAAIHSNWNELSTFGTESFRSSTLAIVKGRPKSSRLETEKVGTGRDRVPVTRRRVRGLPCDAERRLVRALPGPGPSD